ncbi:hypothetical protein F5146DRAFT_653795 [Armillaria mellea]|nr:hypothetical protein F5146DRAFT_653795 [Armillaria mellea]
MHMHRPLALDQGLGMNIAFRSRLSVDTAHPSQRMTSRHCQWSSSPPFSRRSHAHRCPHSLFSHAIFSLLYRPFYTATLTCGMSGIPTHCEYFWSNDEIPRLSRTPSVSARTSAYLIPRVLARTDNLRLLSLPSFDLHIVRHHSAFGLRYVQFRNTCLSGRAEAELLMWLRGQTNVVSL